MEETQGKKSAERRDEEGRKYKYMVQEFGGRLPDRTFQSYSLARCQKIFDYWSGHMGWERSARIIKFVGIQMAGKIKRQADNERKTREEKEGNGKVKAT